MSINQTRRELSITAENEPRFQEELERIAVPWAIKHQSESDSNLTLVQPNLILHPQQRVTEFITEAKPLPELRWAETISPDFRELLIAAAVKYSLAKSMGKTAIQGLLPAHKFIRDLQRTPAIATNPDGPSVAEQLIDDVEHGLNITVALPHQDRSDLVKAAGALVATTHRSDLITRHNFIPISPVMKFEAYKGKYIPEWTNQAGRIVWVLPQASPGASEKVPRTFMVAHNRGAADAYGKFLTDETHGTISYTALSQAGMVQKLNEKKDKLISLDFPKTLDSAASALLLTDKALPIAFFTHPITGKVAWEIGSFIDRDSIKGKSDVEVNLKFLDEIMLDLQSRMRRIAKVPVRYTAADAVMALTESS